IAKKSKKQKLEYDIATPNNSDDSSSEVDENFRMDLKRGLVLSDGEIASDDELSTYDNNNTRKNVTKYVEDCYVISDLQHRPTKKPKLCQ
ncbi:hypothetical protein, partial [Klebsiella aerogenes]|uniref:hypothetical protein n=1 Tax=Klebsiella aerogenes TaxID=548 RepID=UPI001CC3CD6D